MEEEIGKMEAFKIKANCTFPWHKSGYGDEEKNEEDEEEDNEEVNSDSDEDNGEKADRNMEDDNCLGRR